MRALKWGVGLLVVGVVITIGTYVAARSRGGGTYVISFGPIIFGLLRIVQAGSALTRFRQRGYPRGYDPGYPQGYEPFPTATPATASPLLVCAPVGVGTPTATGTPAGWYPDPGDGGGLRYFDGAAWTAHTSPIPGQP